jgi:hypothetical protein
MCFLAVLLLLIYWWEYRSYEKRDTELMLSVMQDCEKEAPDRWKAMWKEEYDKRRLPLALDFIHKSVITFFIACLITLLAMMDWIIGAVHRWHHLW